MGAKQSKRSVDISGKEAESAGEVAAAGAGGEGRMEQLADADALKPQANGDAHIQDTPEKEKQLDSGTPENEKDATTEKDIKDKEENEKENETAVSNGESEPKEENGDSTPSPDDGKKNKKEKVKKKWSLRSISFSRKEKPKQEKKQKDDESKTNGEPEKVPEEVAETAQEEVAEKEVADETKSDIENKDEKTPETPVTEPLTNGSSTPESPKVEILVTEEPKIESNESDIRPEPKAEVVEPEQLPINGLSLEDSKKDDPEIPETDSNKTEAPKIEINETVPTSESPLKKEVCVDQKPLIEPTPPPLPANPPPSSVASFAATTMAPELSDASPANKADSTKTLPADEIPDAIQNTDALPTQPQDSDTNKTNSKHEVTESGVPLNGVTETQIIDEKNVELTLPSNESVPETFPSHDDLSTGTVETNICDVPTNTTDLQNESPTPKTEIETKEATPVESIKPVQNIPDIEITSQELSEEIDNTKIVKVEEDSGICELKDAESDATVISQNEINRESDASNETECLKAKAKEIVENSINMPVVNGEPTLTNGDSTPPAESIEDLAESGDGSAKLAMVSEDSMPPSLSEPLEQPQAAAEEISESFPLPPSDLCPTESEISAPASPEPLAESPAASQEAAPISDKISDLIPEIPTIPELNTETETTSEVAVAD